MEPDENPDEHYDWTAHLERRPAREIGRTHARGGQLGTDANCVIVGVDHGRITFRGEATLDANSVLHHIRMIVRAVEAAAIYRGQQLGPRPGQAGDGQREAAAPAS
jgi:hypothetical protein